MLPYQKTQLANGLQLLTIEQPHLHSAHVSLFIRCGSRYESDGTWGLSHFVEHMLFRGSHQFPDSRKLAQVFERAGGFLDAATWRDHTSFTTDLHPSRLRHVLAALADMVGRPRFVDLDLERGIVEEEVKAELDDNGDDTDPHNLSRSCIWRDHPMGRRIVGSVDALHAFQQDDVIQHHAQHYVGSNMVLCVAGNVQHNNVMAIVHDTFGQLPAGHAIGSGPAVRFASESPLLARAQSGSQIRMLLSFACLPDGHPDFAALSLLSRTLDDGISSRLHQAVCERKGLVYELSTGLDCYWDCGIYDIDLQVAPRRAAPALESVLDTLQVLCESGVTDEEVEQAREQSLHELEFRMDASGDVAEQYGCSALFGRISTVEQERDALLAVTSHDVLRVARRVFRSGDVHVTVVGPIGRANMTRVQQLVDDFSATATQETHSDAAPSAPAEEPTGRQERLGPLAAVRDHQTSSGLS